MFYYKKRFWHISIITILTLLVCRLLYTWDALMNLVWMEVAIVGPLLNMRNLGVYIGYTAMSIAAGAIWFAIWKTSGIIVGLIAARLERGRR